MLSFVKLRPSVPFGRGGQMSRRCFGDWRPFVQAQKTAAKMTAAKAAVNTKTPLTRTSLSSLECRRVLKKLKSQDHEMDMMRIQLADIRAGIDRLQMLVRQHPR